MLFLRIISWKGVSCFNGERGRGGVFQMGRASFLSGGVPHEGASTSVGGGFSKKIVRWGNPAVCLPFIIQKVAQIKFNVILTPL